jgi:hypothetical protein
MWHHMWCMVPWTRSAHQPTHKSISAQILGQMVISAQILGQMFNHVARFLSWALHGPSRIAQHVIHQPLCSSRNGTTPCTIGTTHRRAMTTEWLRNHMHWSRDETHPLVHPMQSNGSYTPQYAPHNMHPHSTKTHEHRAWYQDTSKTSTNDDVRQPKSKRP